MEKIENGDLVRVINGEHEDRHLAGTEGIMIKRYGFGRSKAQIMLYNNYGQPSGRITVELKNIELVQKKDTGIEVSDEEFNEQVTW